MKRNSGITGLLTWAFLGIASCPLSAAEFSARITDGLGRPVPGASVEVSWNKQLTGDNTEKVSLAKVTTDTNGVAAGKYDEKSFPPRQVLSIDIRKAGYAGYTAGPQTDYVLKRQFRPEDVARIAKLGGDTQKAEMRELLAGEFDSTNQNLVDIVFFQSREFRPVLRTLVQDPRVNLQAGEQLAYIGVPEDVRMLVQYAASPKKDAALSRWATRVVSAMIEPGSERDWAYLKKCVLNEYNDHWVDRVTVRTLKLNASARALLILQDARKQNTFLTNEIDAAVAYINSSPQPLEDRNLEVAGRKVADALGTGLWMGNELPRYNEQRDLALVDCNFVVGGKERLVHTATFQNVGGVWKLRGVRETQRTLMPSGPQRVSQNPK